MTSATLRRAAPGASPAKGEALVAVAKTLRDQFRVDAAKRDLDRIIPHEELAALKASGILSARIPASHGGPDLPWTDVARIFYDLSRADPNIGQAIQAHTAIIEILRIDAPEPIRRRIFDHVLAGGMITNAVAERHVAFYGDIGSRLLRTAQGYRLRGRKYYATGSLFAEDLMITARAEDDRIATIVIPANRAGLVIEDDWNGMGQRTTASGTVALNDVAVSGDEVFFAPPAAERRWHVQAAAQLLHVAIDAGIARAAYEDALELARRHGRTLRESGVAAAVEDPYVLAAIGDLSTESVVAEAITLRAAGIVDRACERFHAGTVTEADLSEASIAVAEAKIVTTRAALKNGEKLYEVANASGTDRSLNLDRHWRNARTHTTHDPLAYKFRFIGDYRLNGRAPPATVKI
ncbi:acyl-CoA dehydrogenase family protein [Ensifer soli]|uniref:acyl-CoA dehydrogenase family protein n=1 Tax=Ciceribacter sp. sgz301302 TaxID=3342379 RepID=UPI0035B80FE2